METFEIIDITEDGKGVAKKDSLVYFIKGARLGDIVTITNEKKKRNYIEAEIKDVFKKSNFKIISNCKYFPKCQNCAFQDINYEKELEFKKNKVINNLRRIGNVENIEELCKEDITIAGSDTSGYRNKVTLKIKDGKIGYYKRKTNELIEIDKCIIANEKINEIIYLISNNKKNNINLKYFSEIMIRVIDNNIQLQFTLFKKYNIKDIVKLEKSNLLEFKNNIENKKYNIEIGIKQDNKYIEIIKEESVIDFLNYKLYIHPNSFFQVNKKQAENIYNDILNTIKNENVSTKTLIDLYSGVGVSTILFSKIFKNIIAIEINKEAIEMATENIKLNNIDNAKCILGKAEEEIIKIDIPKGSYVFVDPPRAGLNKKVIDKIIQSGVENIVYMSCNSSSLARDLKIFKENMYDIQKIAIYDMFPRTLHVETVAYISKTIND